MSSPTDTTALDPCGCCEGTPEASAPSNPPGQSALAYRVGTHPTFLARMLARIHTWTLPDGGALGERPLAYLTARDSDDPSTALLDAWAAAADVLTFYQERIANEGFLRTATERRSVLELAGAIGYELRPGVAAGVYLAFTVDDAKGAPGEAVVEAGTQAQSIPAAQGELPQTFETGDAFTAYAAWNALRPRLSQAQEVDANTDGLYLQGTALNLNVGDVLLLVEVDEDGVVQEAAPRHIEAVETDTKQGHTYVALESRAVSRVKAARTTIQSVSGVQASSTQNFALLLMQPLQEYRMSAVGKMSGVSEEEVLAYAKQLTLAGASGVQVYAMREKAGFFGHNAPYYSSLPERDPDYAVDSHGNIRDGSGNVDPNAAKPRGYDHDWDDGGWSITKDSLDGNYYDDATVYLERPISGITKESWAVFEQTSGSSLASVACQVTEAFEASVAGFALSAKGTGLNLKDGNGDVRCFGCGAGGLDDFKVRKTTAYAKSEELELAVLPITDDLAAGATELTLDGMVLGLAAGQPVALTGERADLAGVTNTEIKVLSGIVHSGTEDTAGYTTVGFTEGLVYGYKRDTVAINANVVHATHGETVSGEALGSGDGAQPHQRFALKKPPLTYTSAPTATGSESTLTVRVDQVAWEEVPSFYGLDGTRRSYIVRLDDDANAYVTFGDGKHGARLPTGQENVVATYRSGIGLGGEVDAGSITLLKKRPFGVRSVVNPLAAAGADDPETLGDARTNAPLTVLTLDRIVSLQDYEDFARAYSGIGKARAVALWSGEALAVHVTIADADGDEVDTASDLYRDLSDAIEVARNPLQVVDVGSFRLRLFEVDARVWIDPAYAWENVEPAIRSALVAAFGFEARSFGQPVTSAEVLTVVHGVQGVVAVDLEGLYRLNEDGAPVDENDTPVPLDGTGSPAVALLASRLPARPAHYDADAEAIQAAELLLINEAGITLAEATR